MTHPVKPLARFAFAASLGAALVVSSGTALGQAKAGAKPLQGQVVKLAWIDPLSGPFGPVGTNQLNSWKYFVDKFNANNPAGVKFEITGYDNKGAPAE
jgi:branched-chain amino acid transport system substrate-binding protein